MHKSATILAHLLLNLLFKHDLNQSINKYTTKVDILHFY